MAISACLCPLDYIFTGKLKVCQIAVTWMLFVSALLLHIEINHIMVKCFSYVHPHTRSRQKLYTVCRASWICHQPNMAAYDPSLLYLLKPWQDTASQADDLKISQVMEMLPATAVFHLRNVPISIITNAWRR